MDVQSFGVRDDFIDCPQSDDQSANDKIIGFAMNNCGTKNVDDFLCTTNTTRNVWSSCCHETQVVETGEADLHNELTRCAKNPGHKLFIPIGTFSLNHLPEGHNDIDLYKLIKALADLTVRVAVRITSPNRPEFGPMPNVPYPFYNIRNSKKLRMGTGRIYNCAKFTDGVHESGKYHSKNVTKCWCKTCEASDSPSNVWWEFHVITATHVVFDEIEAEQTTLRLFYDRDDSPVVNVNKVRIETVSIEYDKCVLDCVTCDKNLGNKLELIECYYMIVEMKVKDKYFKLRDVHKLNFIVSHPHGCSKQVSVGQWHEKYHLGALFNVFTYKTCTCPGSSGANVLCIGYDDLGWLCKLIHCGSFKFGLNYSGLAINESPLDENRIHGNV